MGYRRWIIFCNYSRLQLWQIRVLAVFSQTANRKQRTRHCRYTGVYSASLSSHFPLVFQGVIFRNISIDISKIPMTKAKCISFSFFLVKNFRPNRNQSIQIPWARIFMIYILNYLSDYTPYIVVETGQTEHRLTHHRITDTDLQVWVLVWPYLPKLFRNAIQQGPLSSGFG
jgi:hypothetical protein